MHIHPRFPTLSHICLQLYLGLIRESYPLPLPFHPLPPHPHPNFIQARFFFMMFFLSWINELQGCQWGYLLVHFCISLLHLSKVCWCSVTMSRLKYCLSFLLLLLLLLLLLFLFLFVFVVAVVVFVLVLFSDACFSLDLFK